MANIYRRFGKHHILLQFISIILSINVAHGLNCFICAEGGLEEFGECKTSFPFSCDGYAKRFAADEKIFCRTTRHKTFNGTYTVVKECIADSAHHATFPRKSYQLEEECDVLDLNGFEVAYCICRAGDLCNAPAIVDQFAAFEEKYPELFDPEPTDQAETGRQNPSSQEDQENSAELATNAFTSMVTPPTRRPLVDGNVHLPTNVEINPFSAPMPPETMLRPNAGENEDEGEEGAKETTNIGAFVTVPIRTTAITHKQPATSWLGSSSSSAGTGSQLGTLPELRCMQCSESNLSDLHADCTTQITVSCPDQSKLVSGIGRPLCFSRQVINPKTNQHGVEKMCATERAVLNEFGAGAVAMLNSAIAGEASSCSVQRTAAESAAESAAQQRVCICTSAQCNRPSVAQQVSSSKLMNEQTPLLTLTMSPPTEPISNLELESTKSDQKTEPLNCAVCLDSELSDPQADCQSASAQNCAHQIRDENAYCLTRQTQNGKNGFIVEKSCVTKRQFYQQFPEELQKHSIDQVPIGCASTYDGFVNYCICDGQMCNRNSLAQQAEAIGRPRNPVNNNNTKNKTQLTSSATKSGEHGAKLASIEATTTEQKMETTNSPTTKPFAEWVQNDGENGHMINRHPKPSGAKSNSVEEFATTPTPAPTPAPTPTSTSSAIRERLEKWKQNSEMPKKSGKMGSPEWEDDQESGSGASRNCWMIPTLLAGIMIIIPMIRLSLH